MNLPAVRDALSIVMKSGLFQFNDTYWYQKTGTVMGTPPAPMYATLYFAIHEAAVNPRFKDNLTFYQRYIDDILGIWIPSSDDDDQRWEDFQREINKFGKLKWEFSERAKSTTFMDLELTITDGRVTSKLFEKALNLHLYLPTTTAHPPSVLKGMVHGTVKRIHRLSSDEANQRDSTRDFYIRLRQRGYTPRLLHPIFRDALAKKVTTNDKETDEPRAVHFHMPFHPGNPRSFQLQHLFRHHLLRPYSGWPLYMVRNHKKARLNVRRMIVAFHKPRSLRNLLFPWRLRQSPGSEVSVFLRRKQRSRTTTTTTTTTTKTTTTMTENSSEKK